MFGASLGTTVKGESVVKQDESTPFQPRSPYGVAKAAAHYITKIYRDGYNLFACNGILFNHESERRGEEFVSRKITKHLAKVHTDLWRKAYQHHWPAGGVKNAIADLSLLKLGNTEAYRDWGYAPDFVDAMWLMLQQDTPDDFVIATGETHSVKEFVITAFSKVLGYYSDSLVETDETLFRAAEVNYLCGNYAKAKAKLGWEPKVKFDQLVERMLLSDINVERKAAGFEPTPLITAQDFPKEMERQYGW
jgi:GDPmannose 4,6-dehydratase